jgi:hypothetical protein
MLAAPSVVVVLMRSIIMIGLFLMASPRSVLSQLGVVLAVATIGRLMAAAVGERVG